jgi:GxxExxY protein
MNHRDTENTEKDLDDLTQQVIGAAIEVHRVLGPGLLESAYEQCLARELSLRGVQFKTQVDLPVEYKGVRLEVGYRMDFVVERSLLLELKAVEKVLPIHEAQVLTYLRLSGLHVALLLNFGEKVLKDGLRRIVL